MTPPSVWLGELAQALAAADPGDFWFWTVASLVAAVASFAAAFHALHRARLIENMATSRVRSAAQGYVELEGFARLLPGPEIRSPLSGARCCWWRYRIERRETVWRNGRRSSDWRTIESGTSDELFVLADATGACVVDPDGASVHPSLKRQWRGTHRRPQRIPDQTPWLQWGDYRYSEQLLQVGDPLYALGWFRTQSAHLEIDEAADLAALLREWKADQQALLARFDANRDGQIDLREWEAVRRSALEQVRSAHVERTLDPDIHVLCRPPDRRSYLLSTLSQHALARSLRLRGALGLIAALPVGSFGLFALTVRGLL